MLLDYLSFSLNNLRRRKLRSWLTMLGIFIGIAAVVSLIGLGEGLKTAINSQFGISSTQVLTVQAGGLSAAGPPGSGVVNPLTFDDAEAIERLSIVENAIPRVIQSVKVEFNDRVSFSVATTIPDGDQRRLVYQAIDIEKAEEGRLLKDGDTNKVLLGNNYLTDDAGLGKPIHPGDNVLIQGKQFEVVGIIEKKGSFMFDKLVAINEEPLMELIDIDDRADIIAVFVKDKDDMDQAKEEVEKLLRKRRDVREGNEDFSVETPDAVLADINTILVGIQIFIVIIASISIIVGAIGIVNTMFTSVVERRKQIGVMKSIGARNSDIFFLFFFESGLMGLSGGLIGTIVGALVSFFGTYGINAWVNSTAHPQLNFILIFGALFGSFMIGSISGIIPAMRAARLHPVEALRK